MTLSGGQKARVNLARAVYHDADIVILDDPLSAVDAAVAKHLFDEYVYIAKLMFSRLTHKFSSHFRCIRGVLKDALVVLVTHQVHFALQADQLLVLKEARPNHIITIMTKVYTWYWKFFEGETS